MDGEAVWSHAARIRSYVGSTGWTLCNLRPTTSPAPSGSRSRPQHRTSAWSAVLHLQSLRSPICGRRSCGGAQRSHLHRPHRQRVRPRVRAGAQSTGGTREHRLAMSRNSKGGRPTLPCECGQPKQAYSTHGCEDCKALNATYIRRKPLQQWRPPPLEYGGPTSLHIGSVSNSKGYLHRIRALGTLHDPADVGFSIGNIIAQLEDLDYLDGS